MMLSILPAFALLALQQARPSLVPSLGAIAPAPPRFLATRPQPKDEESFSVPWLAAGVGGGALTGAFMGAVLATGGCSRAPNAPVPAAAGLGVLLAGAGSWLGYSAARGSEAAKIGTVIFDILGPLVAFASGAGKGSTCG